LSKRDPAREEGVRVSFDDAALRDRFLTWIVLLLSLTVHEWAHAWSAFRLGDDTASREGRFTLNPIAHIDPIGTLLLPLLTNIPFGWAKPVPINPARFRRDVTMSTGTMTTAAAGPISNVVLAVICALIAGAILRFQPDLLPADGGLWALLSLAIILNVNLAVFNFLPIPPLDGSRVVEGLLPYRYRPQWESFVRYAPFVLLAVIFLGRGPLDVPMRWLRRVIFDVLHAVAGA
jgi:Zn-dependent protease